VSVLASTSSETESVCPVCLERIPARHVTEGADTFLQKRCAEHGEFRTIVWRGPPAFEAWERPSRPPSFPLHPEAPVSRGCPFDCGLCPEHQQHSCCVLLEVTARCNLRCPLCFASAGGASVDPPFEALEARLHRLFERAGRVNVQLSGGEPTLRDDLPALVERARTLGFDFLQLNTNGLRLAKDAAYAQELKDAGLGCVYLQFDGVSDEALVRLRGAPVFRTKVEAVSRCAELGLGVVLVATVVPNVNDGALGDLVRFALAQGPTVRGVHFQPVSYFGRYPSPPSDADRITLPEVMRGLERQTDGMLRLADFRPPTAENAHCSFSATYERTGDGRLRAAGASSCCCVPRPGQEAKKARDAVARRWLHPDAAGGEAGSSASATASLDAFLERARKATFSISGMAFQDAWTVDLARLRDCFIHVASEHTVPFCAFNLTSQLGRGLYRRT
jgi:7,8-dihydro-6-hydroxymethylpterin dimethyltransferase